MTMLSILAAGLMLAGADPVPETPPETLNCLAIANIRQTLVVDGQTIDFRLRDGSIWRNRLPYSCPQLGFERAFSYQTAQSQLCRQDIISVIQQTGSQPIASRCGLGEFVRQPAAARQPPKP
jgi:hypothetical protein